MCLQGWTTSASRRSRKTRSFDIRLRGTSERTCWAALRRRQGGSEPPGSSMGAAAAPLAPLSARHWRLAVLLACLGVLVGGAATQWHTLRRLFGQTNWTGGELTSNPSET